MEEMQTEYDKLIVKIFLGLSEIGFIIVVTIMSVISGSLIFYARKYIYKFLDWIGISYFQNRLKNIRGVNSDLLWCMGALRSDSYALFRTHNGKPFIEDCSEFSSKESDRMKHIDTFKKIKIQKINSKPDTFFPEILDNEIYRSIIDVSISNDWQLISYEFVKTQNSNSPLLVFLESNKIDNMISFRIWDKNSKTYGIILFTFGKKPDIDNLFTREVSKKLDSISIRFQNYIESSLMENIFNIRMDV